MLKDDGIEDNELENDEKQGKLKALKEKEKLLKQLLKEVQDELGIDEDEWNTNEGKSKRKKVLDGLSNIFKKISQVLKDSITKKEKVRMLQSILKVSTIGSLITGIVMFISQTNIFGPGPAKIGGGGFWFDLALLLFVIRILHKVISAGGIMYSQISDIWNGVKKDVKTKAKTNENFMPIKDYADIKRLNECYTYL